MTYEVILKSTDPARPDEALLQLILDRQNELAAFLQSDPLVEDVTVEPPAAFPTGLEAFAVIVAISFAKGIVGGFAEGAGKKIGEAVGAEVGKRIGARINEWIKKEFPDVVVKKVQEV
jgi:hypothetical protein